MNDFLHAHDVDWSNEPSSGEAEAPRAGSSSRARGVVELGGAVTNRARLLDLLARSEVRTAGGDVGWLDRMATEATGRAVVRHEAPCAGATAS